MSKVKSNFLLLDRCKTSMTEEFYISSNIPIPFSSLKFQGTFSIQVLGLKVLKEYLVKIFLPQICNILLMSCA